MEKKYRPYLTVSQLQIIQNTLATTPNPSIENVKLEKYLRKYLRDIEEGFTAPNYTASAKKSGIESDLGISTEDLIPILLASPIAELNSKQIAILLAADESKYEISKEKLEELNSRYMELEFGA